MYRRRCETCADDRADAGFTLFEILVVMAVLAMAMTAIASHYRSPSAGTVLKTAAATMASRIRDMRSAAIATGSERVVSVDVDGRSLSFGDGRASLQLDPTLSLSVTAADSERRGPSKAGIRFFPNGSSTGATIQLRSERQKYEVRVNWLTGRVSTAAVD